MSNIIEFYSRKKEYGYFSNFWKAPVIIDGKIYPTIVHYYQAAKFFTTDPAYASGIQNESITAAIKMGKSKHHPLRPDWEQIKDDIMRKALRAKFEQHSNLRLKLMKTINMKLVARTKYNSYWGDGGNGKGKNMLGVLLMELRESYVKEHERDLENIKHLRTTFDGINVKSN